jgi:hypothetical protein
MSSFRRILMLTPLLLFNGIQQSFVSGEFTANFIRPSLGQAAIGNVMAVWGFVNVLACFGFGRLAQRLVHANIFTG